MKHDRRHAEAFALMWYACTCGHRERIWNSRDGVTPFGIGCPSCGRAALTHVDWHLDEYAPAHDVAPGQAFFRDGTAQEAVAIIERRIAIFAERGQPIPDDVQQRMLRSACEGSDEFRPGWPAVERAASFESPVSTSCWRPTSTI